MHRRFTATVGSPFDETPREYARTPHVGQKKW